jgi:hypothetical protein
MRFVPGIAFERALFGDDRPRMHSEFGVTLGAQVCRGGSGTTAWVADATFWPNQLENPHGDETLRLLQLQAGPQWGEHTYVRVSVGIALQFWAGSDARKKLDVGLSGGLAVGRAMTVGSLGVSPEIAARMSRARGIGTISIGGQAAIGSCGRR